MANYPRKLIICEGLVVIYFLASRTITKAFSKFDFLQSVQMGYFLLSIVLKIVLDRPVQPKTKHQSNPVKTPKSIKTYQKPKIGIKNNLLTVPVFITMLLSTYFKIMILCTCL